MDDQQVEEVEDATRTDPGDASDEATAPQAPRVHLIGCTVAASARVRDCGAEIVDDIDSAGIVIVSTRAADAEVPTPLPEHAVVLVHPDGDARAVALLSLGATGVHAEGDERSILNSLATTSAAESGEDAIVVLRIRRLASVESRTVSSLVHRRLLIRWRSLVTAVGAVLEETDHPERLILRWPAATPADVRGLSLLLASAAEAFIPDGAAPLAFAAGVALADDASDDDARLRLATEAAEIALRRGSACLTAEDVLSASVASRTTATLEAAVDAVERNLGAPGHGERCATLARDVAAHLGLDTAAVQDVASAARFHHVGLIAAGEGAACSQDTRARSAPLLLPHLGNGAADAVAGPLVAACDVVATTQADGGRSAEELLAAVDAEVTDLPAQLRDALSASLRASDRSAQAASA